MEYGNFQQFVECIREKLCYVYDLVASELWAVDIVPASQNCGKTTSF